MKQKLVLISSILSFGYNFRSPEMTGTRASEVEEVVGA